MKYLLIILFPLFALAGFPPTTSQLAGDPDKVTTFNYNFPYFTGTHNGINVSLDMLGVTGGGTGVDGSAAANGSLLIGNGTGYSLSTLTGTTDQVNVTNGAGSITLSLPQDIATTSNPSFNQLTVTDALYGTLNFGQTIARGGSTGVLTSAGLAINGGDNTKFDLGLTYVTFTVNTDAVNATRSSNICGPFTAQTVTNLALATQTYILLDSSCTIIQQTTAPTPQERRQYAFVGRLGHANLTNISFANTVPDLIISPIAQSYDLFDALGPFNINGNEISANGANLSFNKSAGRIFQRSANYMNDNQNPHYSTTAGTTPTTFRYATRAATTPADVTVIDPTMYDDAGTITAVGGGSQSATVQRIFLFNSNQVRVQYGQTVFANLASAIAGFGSVNYVANPAIEGFSVLIGFIAIEKTCTSLQNTTCSRIMLAPRFAQGAGGGGSSGGITTLQQAYQNSVQPQITLNSTQLGIQIRDDATPIGSSLFAVQDNAGTTNYLNVDVNGLSTTNFVGTGTTGAVRVHNLTTAEKNALTPASGMIVYDTDLARMECYANAAWRACSSQLTTKGDLLTYSTTTTRLPVGTDGQVLSANSATTTGLEWVNAGNASYRAVSAQTTLTSLGTITIDTGATAPDETIYIQSSSGAITLSDTPFGSTAPRDGKRITLIGNHATNTAQVVSSDVAKGVMPYNWVSTQYSSITYEYRSTIDRYVVVGTN